MGSQGEMPHGMLVRPASSSIQYRIATWQVHNCQMHYAGSRLMKTFTTLGLLFLPGWALAYQDGWWRNSYFPDVDTFMTMVVLAFWWVLATLTALVGVAIGAGICVALALGASLLVGALSK